ncbi:MAG: hypothetical protein NXI08_12605 [bacterium]|nr:hypothetical protein [bacterium]
MKAEKHVLHSLLIGFFTGLVIGFITMQPALWISLGIGLGVSIGTTLMVVEEEIGLNTKKVLNSNRSSS